MCSLRHVTKKALSLTSVLQLTPRRIQEKLIDRFLAHSFPFISLCVWTTVECECTHTDTHNGEAVYLALFNKYCIHFRWKFGFKIGGPNGRNKRTFPMLKRRNSASAARSTPTLPTAATRPVQQDPPPTTSRPSSTWGRWRPRWGGFMPLVGIWMIREGKERYKVDRQP